METTLESDRVAIGVVEVKYSDGGYEPKTWDWSASRRLLSTTQPQRKKDTTYYFKCMELLRNEHYEISSRLQRTLKQSEIQKHILHGVFYP